MREEERVWLSLLGEGLVGLFFGGYGWASFKEVLIGP